MTHETRKKVMAAALWIGGLAAFAILAAQSLAFDAAALLPIVTDSAWTPTKLLPVAWYQSENNALDSSGYANNGTWGGTEAYVSGKIVNAFSTPLGSVATPVQPKSYSAKSYCFWARPYDLASSSFTRILSDETSGSVGNIEVVYVPSTDTLRVATYDGGPKRVSVSPSLATTNQYTFVCVVASSTNLAVWVNAAYSGQVAAGDTSSYGAAVTIGARQYDSALRFNGAIDDVLFFGRCLTQSEIATLYSESVRQSEKGVAW